MFSPTDISGCLIWLKADDIVVGSSNYVASWKNSGYQTCTFSPRLGFEDRNILQTNSLNNHSTLRITGLGGGLVSNSLTSIPTTSKVTAIYLFKQNLAALGADVQTIFTGPNNLTLSAPQQAYIFSSALQQSKAWLFSYYSTFWSPTYANQASGSGYMGDWIIRADVIDDYMITFRRNGTIVDSGTLITPLPDANGMGPVVPNTYHVGCLGNNFPFSSGDIAEIIVYDRRISNNEIANVENYLKYKYFIGGASASPIFTHGASANASGQYNPFTPLYIEVSPLSTGIPLYINNGISTSMDNVAFYTCAAPSFTGSGELYVAGNTAFSSGTLLYMQATIPSTGVVPLFITTGTPFSSGQSMYMAGFDRASGVNFTLFTNSARNTSTSGNAPLFINVNSSSANPGVSGFSNSATIYTYSAANGEQLSLYVGTDSQDKNNDFMPLFINNHAEGISSGVDLYVGNFNMGHANQAKLYVGGLGSLDGGLIGSDKMNLYLERWPADGISLFMNSSLVPSSVTLYTASANSFNSGVPLFIPGSSQLTYSLNTNLYIDAGFERNNSINLYTHGLPSSNDDVTLYTNGF